jgi:flagellar FliL protein
MDESTEDVAAEAADQGDEKKPKKGIVVPLLAALIGLGGGGALGVMFLGPMIGIKLAASAPLPDSDSEEDDHGGGGHGEEGEAAADGEQLHLIDNLVVNPAGSGGTRFLLASVALEPASESVTEELASRDVELRDALLRTLGSKTVDELVDINLREALATELLGAVEAIVGEGEIRRVFLPQYVIQ